MFRATVGGKTYERQPLAWTKADMLLLARDGQMFRFDPRTAEDAKKTAPEFVGNTHAEVRQALYAEFGDRFVISSSEHFLVVHPQGLHQAWAGRFEELYRAFHQYFRVRGFRTEHAKYPLVAVVFANQNDYFQHAKASGAKITSDTLGHYDVWSNRVFLYDADRHGNADWQANAGTVIHEATHQTAFNTGLHTRLAVTPAWVVEGLATLFEARGVYASRSSDRLTDRYNQQRLGDYRHFAQQSGGNCTLTELLSSDQPFRLNGPRAYAGAWALTFYLSETRPRLYERYLALTASNRPLGTYTPQQRVNDFAQVFGNDLEQIESAWKQWMSEL